MVAPLVQVNGLGKRFGKTEVLRGINFHVFPGEVLGVLGPNGAGKTTTLNCLTTLLRPDSGTASIAGYDVVKAPEAIRALIGLTGQFAAVDGDLTARENLVLFGRLLRLSKTEAKRRADDLLREFELSDVGDRRVKTFSGGMRRRLDLAASIVAEPLVLFLDEPTTGLDPRSRQRLWEVVRDLKSRGITIILTTQYLEEADELADRIIVIDQGQVIAEGTADELKQRVGATFCEIHLVNEAESDRCRTILADLGDIQGKDEQLSLCANDGVNTLTTVVKRLDEAGIALADISLRRPSLDDVFFAVTGHGASDGIAGQGGDQ